MPRSDGPPAGNPELSRLQALSGDVLHTTADPVLQCLIAEAARRLRVPIALISLVLETIQFFRAQRGLPPELAAVRATSIETAFAQRVMQTAGAVAIDDLVAATQMPQELVERYGLGAYLGVPLRLGGEVTGALEVIDRAPRRWRPADAERLATVATRVEKRLQVLAERGASDTPVPEVGRTLKSEIAPLQLAVIEARVAAMELGVLSSLIDGVDARDERVDVERVLGILELLHARLDRASRSSRRILTAFDALQTRTASGQPTITLSRLTDGAEEVTRPLVEQVGGVRWRLHQAACPIAVDEPIGVALISTALLTLVGLMLSRPTPEPLEAWTELDHGLVRIVFGGPARERQGGLRLASALSRLGTDQSVARVELDAQGFSLLLPMPA